MISFEEFDVHKTRCKENKTKSKDVNQVVGDHLRELFKEAKSKPVEIKAGGQVTLGRIMAHRHFYSPGQARLRPWLAGQAHVTKQSNCTQMHLG